MIEFLPTNPIFFTPLEGEVSMIAYDSCDYDLLSSYKQIFEVKTPIIFQFCSDIQDSFTILINDAAVNGAYISFLGTDNEGKYYYKGYYNNKDAGIYHIKVVNSSGGYVKSTICTTANRSNLKRVDYDGCVFSKHPSLGAQSITIPMVISASSQPSVPYSSSYITPNGRLISCNKLSMKRVDFICDKAPFYISELFLNAINHQTVTIDGLEFYLDGEPRLVPSFDGSGFSSLQGSFILVQNSVSFSPCC